MASGAVDRDKEQSRRHRRHDPDSQRPGKTVSDGAQRFQLLLLQRSCADLWAGERHERERTADRMAERPAPDAQQSQTQPAADRYRAMKDIVALSGVRQAALVRTGEISSLELVEAHIRRIEAINP